jgi:dihydrofolate synthase / folylpolyglutamate synthase
MRDKDVRGMLQALLPAIGALIVTRASNPRSADPSTLAAHARKIAPDLPIVVEASPTAALAAAWLRAPRIVVAGSIFLLGDVLKERDGT